MLDVVFVNPGNAQGIYQGLSNRFAAVEPPTWALLLAESARSVGYAVSIVDVNAEQLNVGEAVERINSMGARLICFVVYGQNPNSGTVNMVGASILASALQDSGSETTRSLVGSHASALPAEVLRTERAIDIVFCNEGVYALRNLLGGDPADLAFLETVRGIAFRKADQVMLNAPERVVPQEHMDVDLPGYAWDLLPSKNRPLDLYRAHFWHAEYDHEKRTPFAAIYTSLGCTFQCEFCMINILNRNDNEELGVASNYAGMRFWSPEWVMKQFSTLDEMGVTTIRISDEMFLLNKRYFVPLCEMLRDTGLGKKLRMWAYSRIDTVRSRKHLELIRSAGIKWLALGIESGEKQVRLDVTKGKFEDIDIAEVIKLIEEADINVIGNYLFGLPGDDHASMKKTLDLSLELSTAAWNGYPVIPLPGSELYKKAVSQGARLPDGYLGYSFHSYETLPMQTEFLSPAEIIKFRDDAFHTYHSHKPFLEKVRGRFGSIAIQNIEEMSQIRLTRRLLEESS